MYCSLADIKDRANERTKEILEAHQSLEEFQSVKGKVETEKKQIEGILKSIQSKVEETTVANSKLETTAEADKQRVVLETEAKAEAEMTYTLQTVKNPAKFKEPEMHMKKCKQEMANLSLTTWKRCLLRLLCPRRSPRALQLVLLSWLTSASQGACGDGAGAREEAAGDTGQGCSEQAG